MGQRRWNNAEFSCFNSGSLLADMLFIIAAMVLALVFAGVKAEEDAEKVYQKCANDSKIKYSEFIKKDCCKMLGVHENYPEGLHVEQCELPSPGEEWKCKDSECPLKKSGILSADGKIDYQIAANVYDMTGTINLQWKEIADGVKKTCSEENMQHLPVTDCPASDYHACTMYAGIASCTEWKKEDEDCVIIVGTSRNCTDAIEKIVAKNK